MAIRISGNVVIDDDKTFIVAAANTASRPASPLAGMFRYNTETGSFEGYSGTAWGAVGGADEYARTVSFLGL